MSSTKISDTRFLWYAVQGCYCGDDEKIATYSILSTAESRFLNIIHHIASHISLIIVHHILLDKVIKFHGILLYAQQKYVIL